LRWDKIENDWDVRIALKKLIDRFDHHILSIGSYKDTCKNLITNSNFLIFDEEKEMNEYFKEKHNKSIDGFDFSQFYMVVCKNGKEPEIRYLSRENLKK